MTKTKDTIEGLEKLIKSKKIVYKSLQNLAPITMEGVNQDIQFISQAIEWGKALDQAEGELPEKKEHITHCDYWAKERSCDCDCGSEDFNDGVAIAQPILAKKILECEELEKELGKQEDYGCKLEEQLQSIKDKLTMENVEKIIDSNNEFPNLSLETFRELTTAKLLAYNPKRLAQALIKEIGGGEC